MVFFIFYFLSNSQCNVEKTRAEVKFVGNPYNLRGFILSSSDYNRRAPLASSTPLTEDSSRFCNMLVLLDGGVF